MKRSKRDVIAHLGSTLGRELSTRTVLFHEAAATRMGIGLTDHKCLDFIQRATEPLTAGKLAELTGLTTGAITGVLDRLERDGFVRREKDPSDRRQVYIRLVPSRLEAAHRDIFEPFGAAWDELANRYTVDELELIENYITASIALLTTETARIRGVTDTNEAPREQGVDDGSELGSIKVGVLEIHRGATRFDVSGAPGRFLYRAQLEDNATSVTAKKGHVSIRSGSGFLWRRGGGKITLTESVPWRILVHGGMYRFDARLAKVPIEEIVIQGGINEATLDLAKPEAVVPIRITGGVNKLKIQCPPGTPLRATIHGGATQLVLDTLELGAVDGVVRWESTGFGKADRGYDLIVQGGAHDLAMRATSGS